MLPRDEFVCHVAMPGPSPLATEFLAAGASLHEVPMRRLTTSAGRSYWLLYPLAWPVSVWRLARLIRRWQIDIVHTNSLHCLYGWAAALACRRPHVWHAREIVVQSKAALRLERFLARHFAAKVIAISKAVAAQLDPANVEVIYETADADVFRPDLAGTFRSRERISDTVPLAGCAGRIDTWKGFGILLDAFEHVRREVPGAVLVIAGGPIAGKQTYAADLESRAQRMSGVRWLGPRSDVPELFADLDVFVLPSTEPEPYGLVVVEALASGVPVVATDAGGPPEILARAEAGAGVLVPPGDPEALAAALVEWLGDVTTSTPARKARRPLVRDEVPDFADVFRHV